LFASVSVLLGSAFGSVPTMPEKFVVLKMLKISRRSSPLGPRDGPTRLAITAST
jgi:hypothetical protein